MTHLRRALAPGRTGSMAGRACLVGLAVALVVTAGSFLFADESATEITVVDGQQFAVYDAAFYVTMAKEPAREVIPPFSARPLMPRIVNLLPFDPLTGFRLLTGALAGVAAAALLTLLTHFVDERRAIGGVGLFVASYSVLGLVVNPFSTDAIGVASICWGLLLLVRRSWWWLAVLLLVSGTGRETSAYLLVPMLAVLIWERRRPPLGALVALAAPFAAQVLLRVPGLFYDHLLSFGTDKGPEEILVWNATFHGGLLGAAVWAVVAGIGFVAVLAAWGFRWAPTEPRLLLTLLVPCVASMGVASVWPRLLAFALPALVLVAVHAPVRGAVLWIVAGIDVASALLALTDKGAGTSLALAVLALVGAILVRTAVRHDRAAAVGASP